MEIFTNNLSSRTKNQEQEINQYITLKLENGRTFIYVNGKRFLQCIRLILNISKKDAHRYDEIDSIDEAAHLYSNHIHMNRIVRGAGAIPVPGATHDITPEQEFWGHCSNIQAWVENNYDSRILMANISFPLLRQLTQAGDPVARKVFKEEIAQRLESGYPSVVQYLINQGYIRYLTPDEFKTILETTKFIEKISCQGKMLNRFLTSCVNKFPNLLEDILLKILMLPDGMNFLIASIKEYLGFLHLRLNPRYLTSLKTTLENLYLMENIDDKTCDDIMECICTIEDIAKARNIDLANVSINFIPDIFKHRPEALEQLIEAGFNDEAKLNKKRFRFSRFFYSRCSYCGKMIPRGRDVCDWCGHRKDDDEGFFPYPYIFKPPGGAGGLGKVKRAIPINISIKI